MTVVAGTLIGTAGLAAVARILQRRMTTEIDDLLADVRPAPLAGVRETIWNGCPSRYAAGCAIRPSSGGRGPRRCVCGRKVPSV
jgi:hypothetical protein